MRIVSHNGTLSAPVTGIPDVNPAGQGGLLGLCLDPQFASNRMVYWAFSQNVSGGNLTAVAKGRLADDNSHIENATVIYQAQPAYNGQLHFGGRVIFDKTGHLLATTLRCSDAAIAGIAERAAHHDHQHAAGMRIGDNGTRRRAGVQIYISVAYGAVSRRPGCWRSRPVHRWRGCPRRRRRGTPGAPARLRGRPRFDVGAGDKVPPPAPTHHRRTGQVDVTVHQGRGRHRASAAPWRRGHFTRPRVGVLPLCGRSSANRPAATRPVGTAITPGSRRKAASQWRAGGGA